MTDANDEAGRARTSRVDIIVTTPAGLCAEAAQEARDAIAAGGGRYFRRVPFVPRGTAVGSRLYYVERGNITGYAVIVEIIRVRDGETMQCETTGRIWGEGHYLFCDATTWRWIRPIRMTGFQGVRQLHPGVKVEEIGGWLDPRPTLAAKDLSPA